LTYQLLGRRREAIGARPLEADLADLGRAHSVGHRRQHLNILRFGLMVNSLAIANHRRRRPAELAA
jgi:hypothetical protein